MQNNIESYNSQGIQYEDEIDLIDLIKVLYKNKIMIVLVTLVFIVLGVILALYLPKEYEMKAEIKVADNFLSEPFSSYQLNREFNEKLIKAFNLEKVMSQTTEEKPSYSDYRKMINEIVTINENKAIEGYSIAVRADNTEELNNHLNYYLSEINTLIKTTEGTKLLEKEKLYKEQIEEILPKMKKNLENINKGDSEQLIIEGEIYSIEASELKVLTGSYERSLAAYESVKRSRKLLEGEDVINIIDIDDIPNNPTKPNKKLVVLVALVLGGFLGVFLAFVKEFFKHFDFKKFIEEVEEDK